MVAMVALAKKLLLPLAAVSQDVRLGGWKDAAVGKMALKLLDGAMSQRLTPYAESVGSDSYICVKSVDSLEQKVVSGMSYRFHVQGCPSTTDIHKCTSADKCEQPTNYVVGVYHQIWSKVLQVKSVEPESGVDDASLAGFVATIESASEDIEVDSPTAISDKEKAAIDDWIETNGLNKYGDPLHTMYTGGTPLFDENTGTSIDRYVYIVRKHPSRPWKRESESDDGSSGSDSSLDASSWEEESEEELETDSNGNLRSTMLEAKLATVADTEPSSMRSHDLLKVGLSLGVFCVLIVLVAVAKAAQRRTRFAYGSISSREH